MTRKKVGEVLCLLVLLSGMIGCASSQATSARVSYDCCYTEHRVVIDGRLDEPAWQRADSVTLVQTLTGRPTEVATTARMTWDRTYLYVGFQCEDSDVSATMSHTDNDLWEEQEVVEVFVNTFPESLSYFEFEVNPRNARLDLSCQADTPDGRGFAGEKDWNCVGWYSGIQIDGTLNRSDDTDRGWTCEIAIPFASLLGPDRRVEPGDRWSIGLYRINQIGDAVEYSAWSPTRSPTFHAPGRFGQCTFVKP